jgi:hypothetical protein
MNMEGKPIKQEKIPVGAEDVGDGGAFVYYNDGTSSWVDMKGYAEDQRKIGAPAEHGLTNLISKGKPKDWVEKK